MVLIKIPQVIHDPLALCRVRPGILNESQRRLTVCETGLDPQPFAFHRIGAPVVDARARSNYLIERNSHALAPESKLRGRDMSFVKRERPGQRRHEKFTVLIGEAIASLCETGSGVVHRSDSALQQVRRATRRDERAYRESEIWRRILVLPFEERVNDRAALILMSNGKATDAFDRVQIGAARYRERLPWPRRQAPTYARRFIRQTGSCDL